MSSSLPSAPLPPCQPLTLPAPGQQPPARRERRCDSPPSPARAAHGQVGAAAPRAGHGQPAGPSPAWRPWTSTQPEIWQRLKPLRGWGHLPCLAPCPGFSPEPRWDRHREPQIPAPTTSSYAPGTSSAAALLPRQPLCPPEPPPAPQPVQEPSAGPTPSAGRDVAIAEIAGRERSWRLHQHGGHVLSAHAHRQDPPLGMGQGLRPPQRGRTQLLLLGSPGNVGVRPLPGWEGAPEAWTPHPLWPRGTGALTPCTSPSHGKSLPSQAGAPAGPSPGLSSALRGCFSDAVTFLGLL